MSNAYIVGSRLVVTFTVTDVISGLVADPATVLFTLNPPSLSGIVAGTYTWNGTIWTNSEVVIAIPNRISAGVYTLSITLPYINSAHGTWTVGTKTTANGAGKAEGSGELTFVALKTGALP